MQVPHPAEHPGAVEREIAHERLVATVYPGLCAVATEGHSLKINPVRDRGERLIDHRGLFHIHRLKPGDRLQNHDLNLVIGLLRDVLRNRIHEISLIRARGVRQINCDELHSRLIRVSLQIRHIGRDVIGHGRNVGGRAIVTITAHAQPGTAVHIIAVQNRDLVRAPGARGDRIPVQRRLNRQDVISLIAVNRIVIRNRCIPEPEDTIPDVRRRRERSLNQDLNRRVVRAAITIRHAKIHIIQARDHRPVPASGYGGEISEQIGAIARERRGVAIGICCVTVNEEVPIHKILDIRDIRDCYRVIRNLRILRYTSAGERAARTRVVCVDRDVAPPMRRHRCIIPINVRGSVMPCIVHADVVGVGHIPGAHTPCVIHPEVASAVRKRCWIRRDRSDRDRHRVVIGAAPAVTDPKVHVIDARCSRPATNAGSRVEISEHICPVTRENRRIAIGVRRIIIHRHHAAHTTTPVARVRDRDRIIRNLCILTDAVIG